MIIFSVITSPERPHLFKLTEREIEILQQMANGSTKSKQIALDLGISAKAVHMHLSNVYDKLGVGERTEALRLALKNGWVKLAENTERK